MCRVTFIGYKFVCGDSAFVCVVRASTYEFTLYKVFGSLLEENVYTVCCVRQLFGRVSITHAHMPATQLYIIMIVISALLQSANYYARMYMQ